MIPRTEASDHRIPEKHLQSLFEISLALCLRLSLSLSLSLLLSVSASLSVALCLSVSLSLSLSLSPSVSLSLSLALFTAGQNMQLLTLLIVHNFVRHTQVRSSQVLGQADTNCIFT